MSENDSNPPVACTLTEAEDEERPDQVESVMISTYIGAEERRDGYTLRFEGTDEALLATAEFISNELVCCSFAEYSLQVSPPYEETHLVIEGPDGTKEIFEDGLVDKLEAVNE